RFGRTARSLALLLALYPSVRCSFVAPEVVQVSPDILARLDAHGVRYALTDELTEVIGDVAVVYQRRIRKERFTDPEQYEQARSAIHIDVALMKMLRASAVLMHPL